MSFFVKCDEARPACMNCKKSNRVCSGYSEGLDLVLRDQTKSAKAAVERRQKKSSRREHSPSSDVTIRLSESEDSHAMCFLVSSYVTVPRDPRTDRGFLELLPHFFATLKSNTPLSLALDAVAHCFFAAWERRARYLESPNLRVAYGKALKATRAAISDPIECLSDETLMAVCLLGLFEVCICLEEGISSMQARINYSQTIVCSYRAQVSTVKHFNGAAALITNRNHHVNRDLSNRLTVAVRSAIVC